MYVLTSLGAYLHAIFVRTIDFNKCFIRGPTLPAHFSMSLFFGDIFRHLLPLLILPVLIHNVACC